jgi:hypothetical protein
VIILLRHGLRAAWRTETLINNIGLNTGGQPLSLNRAERAERVDQALNSTRVGVSQLNSEQLAANRQYGLGLIDNIGAACFTQPAPGQSFSDFETLASRLSS